MAAILFLFSTAKRVLTRLCCSLSRQNWGFGVNTLLSFTDGLAWCSVTALSKAAVLAGRDDFGWTNLAHGVLFWRFLAFQAT